MLRWMSVAADLRVVLLLALEGQLVISCHEEAARLRGFIVAEDHEWAVVAGISQGAGIALATMQLRTGVNFHRVVPRFLEHIRPKERAEVDDFTAVMDDVVAVMDVEGIIYGDG
jgi:hypothetical protein